MGVFASLTGEPSIYRYQDREYKVSPWTVEIIAAFERYMERKAHEAFERVSSRLTTPQAEKALSSLIQDIAACVYTFGTPFMSKALQAPEHVKYLFFLCLNKLQPEVDLALARKMVEEDYDGVIQAMNEANLDPNLRKPNSPTSSAT